MDQINSWSNCTLSIGEEVLPKQQNELHDAMNNYQKLEMKGKGSYGAAYLALQLNTKLQCIIKVINISNMNNKQKENAICEAKIMKDLKHPGIIKYYESFFENDTNLCIVMEYAEKGNLEQMLLEYKQNNEYLNETLIIDWFTQLCLAVKYLHDQNIIHRDIKTQNIFITKDNFIKLGDFGIAKEIECKEQLCKTSIGTPYYISPEAFQSKPYNNKSDMWSLGCVLYEMISLRHAFDAKTIEGLGIKILRGQYPPIPEHYSDELKNLVTKLLVVDPTKRFNINDLLKQEILINGAKKYLDKYTQHTIQAKINTQSNYNFNVCKLEELRMNLENQLGLKKLQDYIQQIENDTLDFNNDLSEKNIKDIELLIQLEKQIF
ncbi:unnamed protein product [Paramecium pentaurelia]|uniref:non-specific serine/threonine protein kinase n=1 Tax=Paramecium pentaurelia TaxID=43138 RepID=A0A8S1U9F3_9CILI|nr:unnamed protein product [Paramecium pentaurelia]